MPQPPVFLADRAELQSDVVVLSGPEGRHAATVRRLRPGERADVSDGAGLVAECVVATAGPGGLELAVQSRREVPRPGSRGHGRPGHTQGRPGRAGGRGDDRSRRRPHRAVGRGPLRCGVAGHARGPLAGEVAGHRARGGQAVPPRVDTGCDGPGLGRACLRGDREGGVRHRARAGRQRGPQPSQPAGIGRPCSSWSGRKAGSPARRARLSARLGLPPAGSGLRSCGPRPRGPSPRPSCSAARAAGLVDVPCRWW